MPTGTATFHGMLLSLGANPAFGSFGPPTSLTTPHGPIEQLSLGVI